MSKQMPRPWGELVWKGRRVKGACGRESPDLEADLASSLSHFPGSVISLSGLFPLPRGHKNGDHVLEGMEAANE